MLKMAGQLLAAGLRKTQRPHADSDAAIERRGLKLDTNVNRLYVHKSRPLMVASDHQLDYVHTEFKDPRDGLVKRIYPKGKPYSAGRNASKRRNRRADVVARVEARRAR